MAGKACPPALSSECGQRAFRGPSRTKTQQRGPKRFNFLRDRSPGVGARGRSPRESADPTWGAGVWGDAKGSSRKPFYISPLRAQGAGAGQGLFFYCGGVQGCGGLRAPRCKGDFLKFYVFVKEIIGFRDPRSSRGHSRRARWAQICVRWSTWGSKAGPSGA